MAEVPTVGIEAFASSGPPIFAGKKTLSIRNFALPAELVGKPLIILAIPDGESLPDDVPAGSAADLKCAGIIRFKSGSEAYESREAFEADAHRHGGSPGSILHAKYAGTAGWPGPLGPVYKWEIALAIPFPDGLFDNEPPPALRRRVGRLFDIEGGGFQTLLVPPRTPSLHPEIAKPASVAPEPSLHPEMANFLRLYAVSELSSLFVGNLMRRRPADLGVGLLLLLVACAPTRRRGLLLVAVRTVASLHAFPYVWDSEILSLLTALAVLPILLPTKAATDAASAAARCAAEVRAALGALYLSAGFWKLVTAPRLKPATLQPRPPPHH